MTNLRSTTAVSAMLQSLVASADRLPLSLEIPAVREIRQLSNAEREHWQSQFQGASHLPWFAAFLADGGVVISDSFKALRKDLEEGGYRIHMYDVSDLA